MANKTIGYELTTPDKFFVEINKILPSYIQDNEFILNDVFGKGKVQYLKVHKGLWAQQIDYRLHEDLELFRVAKAKNDYFLIDFYLSDTEIIRESEGKVFKQSFEDVNMVLSSSKTESRALIPKHKRVKIFNILMSRDWLLQNVLEDHEGLKEFFMSDNPIYLSENLDFKLKDFLKQIDFNKNNKLSSISIIIQIIDYLFVQFNKRKLITDQTNIHPDDLNRLLKVKEELDANPQKEILLKELSVAADMSLSKFKRLFKIILGTTPYKCHLQVKMEKAMETLVQGRYSVSETGFLMGYANLSQFSKAFKNHYGILPSEVRVQ